MPKVSKTYRLEEMTINRIEELSKSLTKILGYDVSYTDVIRIAINDMYGEYKSEQIANDILKRGKY